MQDASGYISGMKRRRPQLRSRRRISAAL